MKDLESLTIVPPPGVLEGRHVGVVDGVGGVGGVGGVDGVDGVDGFGVGGDEYKLSYC